MHLSLAATYPVLDAVRHVLANETQLMSRNCGSSRRGPNCGSSLCSWGAGRHDWQRGLTRPYRHPCAGGKLEPDKS